MCEQHTISKPDTFLNSIVAKPQANHGPLFVALSGAIKLDNTSVLLENIDTYVKMSHASFF